MRKKFVFVMLALLAAFLLSGCSSAASRGTSWPGLSVDGETAYLADGAQVYAVNLKDGTQAWRYPESPNPAKLNFIAAPVITSDGLVIVGSAGSSYNLVAINPKKFPATPAQPVGGFQKLLCTIGLAVCPEPLKVEEWIFTDAKDHWVASPLIVGDKLFAPNSDGNLYVLGLKDGKPVKVIALAGRLWGTPLSDKDGKRIYVTSLDHSVFAVDTATYEILWHKDLNVGIPSSPTFGADGMLYVGSFSSHLERIDPNTGDHQPVLETKGWVWNAPAADGNTLYFGDANGYFYAFDSSAGKLNWEPKKPDDAITAGPLVLGDRILVATESGAVYEINKDGQYQKWVEPGGKIYTTPVLAGNLVLVAPLGSAQYLYAYNQENGVLAWAFVPGK